MLEETDYIRQPLLSLQQIGNVYKHVDQIIDNLDEVALYQLFQGYDRDISQVMNSLIKETTDVLYSPHVNIKGLSWGYLDKFSESVEETLRCLSLNYFILSVLPDFEMNQHHVEWGNLIQIYKYLCVIAARGHGKSYFFSFAYILWKMYRYNKGDLYNRFQHEISLCREGMLVTNEFTLAKHLLNFVKQEIEDNQILRKKLFPEQRDGWGKEGLKCKNGASIYVKSYGSRMRGFHPTWIVVDDFLNESCLYSEEQNKKYIDFFHSVIMNMPPAHGQTIVVGTPFKRNDLYGNLKESPGWKVLEYPAVFPDGSILWPNRFSLQSLLAKKASQGSIRFTREILVRPISSDSTIFPWSILEKAFIGMDHITLENNIWSYKKKFKKVVTGCDFAISANVGADYSVFITIGIDELNNYWLLHMYRERGKGYNEQMSALKQIHANFRPEIMMMEDNSFQILFTQMSRESNLPVVGHTTGTNKYSLEMGYPAMSTLFELGRIKFPRGDAKSKDQTDIICSELSSVSWTDKGKLQGVGEHDDTVAALHKACLAAVYVNKSFSFGFI